MKTSDWTAILNANVLLIGENSTLQWKDEVIEHAMFLNYYFNPRPYDLGERSRYSEAKTMFEYLKEITNGECRAEQVYGTLLCHEILTKPLKGKHFLIPEKYIKNGIVHIKEILAENKNIKYIFAIGLQTNYYLQKYGVYDCGELTNEFIKGAEPRNSGIQSHYPFYQPVNAKPFREICFKIFDMKEYKNIKIIPILPIKSYPLTGAELNNFKKNFDELKTSFLEINSKNK